MDLPVALKKYFWGDNLDDIRWPKHQKYIAQTLLDKGNENAISWLFSLVGKNKITRMLPKLKLSKKSSNFWKIYLL